MSVENNEADKKLCCASCGKAEIDEVKLMKCDDCDLVRYCSDECQINHKSEHEESCKKRAAELRDELLFKQPEGSYLGDCPICCLPLSLYTNKSTMNNCCSKVICDGCVIANKIREDEASMVHSCPFCRKPLPDTDEEIDKQRMKRVEANDPLAIRREGRNQYYKGDFVKAFEYYTKAAELGNAEAHYQLSNMYLKGQGVEKDEGKEVYHLEEAAIGGHQVARYNLGCDEWSNNRIDRALKHWIIAATQGDDHAIKNLMKVFKKGLIAKEDLASALRAHQAAVDATKSPQREAAEKYEIWRSTFQDA